MQVTTGERSEAEYNRLWETNVVGTFLISKRLAPLMNKGAPLQRCSQEVVQMCTRIDACTCSCACSRSAAGC